MGDGIKLPWGILLYSRMAAAEAISIKELPREKLDNEKRRKKKESVILEKVIKHSLQSRLYTHIQLASKLSSGCDYSLFKDGIEPMWEDSRNKRGGRWLITLSKQQRHSDLDALWLETLLCLIGEAFDEYSEEVCGAVINIRAKGDKIAIWTRETENREAVTHIGKVYKERLGLSSKVVIGYQAHADTATKSSSLSKNKFVV
eukprot:XP_012815283.2 PREDICTED: eukaryotic translation initiation factor 4E type 1B isoform X2 [Xenopus tropicalis]